MKAIDSLAALTDLGRVRLSDNFFMRDMLYSEVANFYRIPNIPEEPDLAIEAGTKLCCLVLEPLLRWFGHITIRSAYRSPTLNAHCHKLYSEGVRDAWCTSNDDNAAYHIWDLRDTSGRLGATATIIIPAYIEHFRATQEWRPLGWWMRDHLADYAHIQFFSKLCAFNIGWREGENDQQIGFLDPPTRELLTKRGDPFFAGPHLEAYEHVPILTEERK